MKISELKTVLVLSGVKIIGIEKFGEADEHNDLIREIQFVNSNQLFKIVWFINVCALHTPCGLQVPFDRVVNMLSLSPKHENCLSFENSGQRVATLDLDVI